MGFTVRFFIGTVLVLLCFWATETAELSQQATNKPINNETEVSTVANLTIPKTDSEEKNVDKQNNVVGKLQESESYKKPSQPETARSIDIGKYVSKDFHSNNNVYSLPISPETQKFIDPDYASSSTPKHDFTAKFDFEAELTTPRSHIFDDRYKEAVESVDQKLEHIDDSHEVSSESESKESVTLEQLLEETKKNDTKADLSYVNYKNIVNNDTAGKNSLHKDTVIEDVTNLNFRSEFNHTTVTDEDDSGNNTVVKSPKEKSEVTTLSNLIPIKGDLDNAESSTTKAVVLTTRKSSITKPPTNRNSIISNNIETETVKPVSDDALKVLPITEKLKGQPEIAPNLTQNDNNLIKIVKRPFTLNNEATTMKVDKNDIQKKSEQQLQENQIIPIQVEAPIDLKHNTKSALPESTTVSEKIIPKNTTTNPDLQTTEETVETTSTPAMITTEKKLEITTTQIPETDSTTPSPELVNKSNKNESDVVTNFWNDSDVETVTSIVTQTSVSIQITTQQPKNESKVTFPKYEVETTTELETTTNFVETESTTATTFLSDSTAATTEDTTTMQPESTTEENTTTEFFTTQNISSTTETSVRSSKGLTYEEVTTTIPEVTTEVTTFITETTYFEATEPKTEETVTEGKVATRIVPELKNVPTDFPIEEVTTDNHTMTSQFYDGNDGGDNSGVVAAIAISSVAALCLIVVVGLLVIMRKRQKRFNYGQRCRPVSLDDYSMDNVSVYNSVRRKGMARGSKRSYGNPAFEDPTSVSHPLNFPALGKFANNLEDMKAEFEEIPQITAKMNELPEGCDTKNRYANVIPLPETRVFLTSIEGYQNSDYINANYVTGPKNTKGYYIACQAPMQSTVDDFWRMVWEQQCKVILMLTHLFENGVEKCVDYLPPSEVLDCHRLFGDFQVTLKKREVKDKYIISSLQLKNMVSNSWREVTHFWYLGWPEKGVPSEANSLIAFLIEARSYMKSSSLDRKDATNGNLNNGMSKNEINPVVVHCSPGTGRTGVVIACDIAIREFEQNRLVDIPRIVYRIRRDRASAVQTKEQYIFIYKVVSLYATKLTGGALDSL